MANKFKLVIVKSTSWVLGPMVAFALSVVLSQIPLFNTLGYESSLVLGVVLPLFFGLLGATTLSRAQKFSSALFTFLAPPLVMLVNMLFVRNCSFVEGLGFYVLSVGIGGIFAYSMMRFLKSLNFKFVVAVYVSLYVGIVILPTLYRFYFTPQIFFFNHIFGFFSGAIYDDAIELERRYILFRAETILLSAFLLLYSFRQKFSMRDLIVVTISFFPLILPFELGSDEFGFTSSHATLAKVLVPIDTDRDWRISPKSDSLTRQRTVARLEAELRDLKKTLALDTLPNISIFIYPNAEEKRKYTGAENVEFTKPWRKEIHITEQSFSTTIRHELVHILFARYGISGLGISNSIGLVEGIAVAFETPDFDWTAHELAAALLSNNLAPKKSESLLGSFGFWTGLGATSYTLMGSFVRYLVDSYGIEAFKAVYAESDFLRVYNKPLSGLMLEWKEFLSEQAVPPALDSTVLYRFKRKTIFQTECPHRVAVELKYGSRALAEKRYHEALERFKTVLTLTDGKNPRAVQGHFSASLLQAVKDSLPLDEVFRKADSLTRRLEKPEPILFSVANAMLWTGFGSRDSVQSLLTTVKASSLSFNYDYAVALRLEALRIDLDMTYFSPFTSNSERDAILVREFETAKDSSAKAFIAFLKAERLLAQGKDSSAVALLATLPVFERPELEFQRRYDVLDALLRLGRADSIPSAIAMARESATRFVGRRQKEKSIDALIALYNWQSGRQNE
ncbi:MAG: hypothetical protein ACUVRP_09715 [Chlorobiales bacterium]